MEFLKRSLLFISVVLILSCVSRKTLLYRPSENTTTLNMNGIFYRKLNEGIVSFILYRDGVYLYNSVSNCKTIECHTIHIAKYSKRKTKGNYYDEKGDWGIYNQTSNKIRIDRYWPIGFGSYGIQSMKGNILDSETIEITKFNGKDLKETWIYHFHPYSPKPDSTNNFIR